MPETPGNFPFPRPSCHAAVMRDGYVLLVKRKHDPYQGWWGLPGGAVELGEAVEDALTREVREETGLDVAAGEFLTLRNAIGRDGAGAITYHYVVLFYRARVLGGTLKAGDDAEEAGWTPLDRLPELLVPGARQVIDLLSGGTKTPPTETRQ